MHQDVMVNTGKIPIACLCHSYKISLFLTANNLLLRIEKGFKMSIYLNRINCLLVRRCFKFYISFIYVKKRTTNIMKEDEHKWGLI